MNNINEFTYPIKNIQLNVFTPNKKSIINSDSSFSTGKLSINNRYKSNTFFLRNIYRNFNKDKFYNSSSYLKMNTISSLKNTKIIKKKFNIKLGIGDLGIGDWGLGIGPNPQSPIPNPQSPIPILLFHKMNFI
jgi:hypothetical protein